VSPLSWQVGDVSITAVFESYLRTPPRMMLPEAAEPGPAVDAVKDWAFDGNNLLLAVQAFVVWSAGQVILVDACIGNDREFPWPQFDAPDTDFLDRLTAAGAAPADVDLVVCTHLHFDHVGWLTRREDGDWIPTFPNATHLFAEAEWAHWQTHESHGMSLDDTAARIVQADLHQFVSTDHVITDEVRLIPSVGHTPGHVSVQIASQGQGALITGDAIHHPVQVAEPDWVDLQDVDPVQAQQTRRDLLDGVAGRGDLLIGTHFPAPTAGYVKPSGPSWTFIPAS
jgi:glyoxylase-like metal-dependent hydrolase (beta-lactamase superfamily II)